MRARGAALQGGLALAALAAAYATWQREPEQVQGDAVVVDIGRNDLERVRYEDERRWVELWRPRDSAETAVWMRYGVKELPPAAAADAGSADGGVAQASLTPPPPKTPDREVRANEVGEKLYGRFAPLLAMRALGALEGAKLDELGLSGATRRIEVTAHGVTHAFSVGTSALGMGSPYLRSEKEGRVYLVGGNLLSDLDAASSRLLDRRLHTFSSSELDALTVSAGKSRRELVQTGGDAHPPVKLAAKSAPETADDFAKNWHDKVWRLFPTDVLGKGELPPAGEPKVRVRIDYARKGQPVGWTELAEAGTDSYLRTEHTAGWVKVHAEGELLKEGEKVAAGE